MVGSLKVGPHHLIAQEPRQQPVDGAVDETGDVEKQCGVEDLLLPPGGLHADSGEDHVSSVVKGDGETEEEPVPQVSMLKKGLTILYAILSNTVMMVLLRLWGRTAPTHSWFWCQAWALGFCPFFAVGLVVQRYYRKTPTSILDQSVSFWRQSFLNSFLLAFNYWGVSTSNPHVTGPTQVALAQAPLIFAMVTSSILLRRKYAWDAWVGWAFVLVGTFLSALIPTLQDHASNDNSGKWCLMYIVGMVPLGILPVTFEGFYKSKGSDGKTMTLELRMLATNGILFGWLFAFLPLFLAMGQPHFDDFKDNTGEAMLCVFTGGGGSDDDICVCSGVDACAGSVVLAAVVVAAGQLHSQALLSKQQSGLMANLCLSISPFLADPIFASSALIGRFSETPKLWDILGACCCTAGTILFAFADDRDKKHYPKIESVPFIRWFLDERKFWSAC